MSEHCSTSKKHYFFWSMLLSCLLLYALHISSWFFSFQLPYIEVLAHHLFELINTVWWGILVGLFFIAALNVLPQSLVIKVLGTGQGFKGLLRATLGGVLLDLCSHGILLIGAKLYQRGASIGQVIAFLMASPWNSFSLTLVLIALIGIKWTLIFIGLSFVIGITTGMLFDGCVRLGWLPKNPNTPQRDETSEPLRKAF